MFSSLDFNKLFNLFQYTPHDPLLFGSSLFLFLFTGLLFIYNYLAKNKKLKIFTLILFSLFFYYKAAGYFFLLLVIMALLNFYSGKLIHEIKLDGKRKLIFILSLIINLGLLGYFKYTNFFIQIVNDLSKGIIQPLDIFLPIGISFYTFKALSYVIEIYMGMYEPVKSLRDFTLYMFFFPNILQGPIDRASNFLPQLDEEIIVTKADIGKALFLIMSGLFKKTVIADYIGLNFVDRVYGSPLRFTGVENLLAVYGYSLQIYCDFSGYTDMALGIGLLLGFNLMENFNQPFKASSVADYWRRWHISLSTWLLDYLFKPLQMKFRNYRIYGTALAVFITFFVVGLWHGASWTFVVFGLLHSTYIVFSIFTQKARDLFFKKIRIKDTKFHRFLKVLFTFHLLTFTGILFRAENLKKATDMVSQIFSFFKEGVFLQFVKGYPEVVSLILLGYILHFLPRSWEPKIQEKIANLPVYGQAFLLVFVIWVVIQVKSAALQPFLYFNY
ncbi:MAG: MBOAT family O-acyltransferase [Ignavibacteriaceae bacterium]